MKHPSFHARRTPDKPAYLIADTGETRTYAELDALSNQGAHAFRALGVGPGEHIALLMENRLEFMDICWAAHRSGVIYTAISRYLGPDEVSYIAADCDAQLFITSAKYADVAAELRRRILSDSAHPVRFLMVGAPPGGLPEGFEPWDALVAGQPTTPVADETCGMDMLYSSGTTGRPKGITKTFEPKPIDDIHPLLSLLCEKMCGMGPETVYLSPAPLYHAAPLRYCLTTVSLGGTCVIMQKFDAERLLDLIERYRVTHTQVVPTMFVRLLKLPEAVRAKYDMSSLQGAVHAAAPCPVEVKRQMIEWWGPILLEYYAGTEANGGTMITSEEWLAHPGSVGRALSGRIVVVGPDGAELPPGQVGDVYFETGVNFRYHKAPEKTEGAFLRDGCGTLGDVGYVDEEGYLYLTDRASYMIISGGVNVYPQEVEDLLICHPAISDAAVFGVPNEDLGEEVKAVVQLEDPAQATPTFAAELIGYCRERLSPIKCPKSIDFRAELPRTPTGKLMKRKLKDEYWQNKQATGKTA